jgi:glycosyltransferase involved in cell wall biosynthesis
VDVLITACSKLVAQFPKLQCHVVGDGPLRKQLQAQAVALSIAKQIHFHGVIEHCQLAKWYHAADLVVLPSLAEGVPNVLRESIACGRPYVASATGGIPEISDHEGCALVPPGDPQTLANTIANKLQDGKTPASTNRSTESWDQAGRHLGRVLEDIGQLINNEQVARLAPGNVVGIIPPAA